MKLSVVVSAYNEEEKIEECLKSCSFADEIILVDNSSSDKTAELAKRYTSKIFTRPNNQIMLNVNKNYGFSKAKNDWILNLDADERVSEELKKEIQDILESPSADGYWIPRKNVIFGKWIEHAGWYPDYVMRFFKKGKGSFPEKHVHEFIEVKGETGYLKNPLVHYNYENLSQFLRKMQIYVESESRNLTEKGYVLKPIDAIKFPFEEFLSRFFAREGYKDGLHGLVLSLLMAFYHLCIFVNLWEKQKFKYSDINALSLFEGESKKMHKDLKYWIRNEKLKSAGFLKKFLYKVKK